VIYFVLPLGCLGGGGVILPNLSVRLSAFGCELDFDDFAINNHFHFLGVVGFGGGGVIFPVLGLGCGGGAVTLPFVSFGF
jgi:hypothetical protein